MITLHENMITLHEKCLVTCKKVKCHIIASVFGTPKPVRASCHPCTWRERDPGSIPCDRAGGVIDRLQVDRLQVDRFYKVSNSLIGDTNCVT